MFPKRPEFNPNLSIKARNEEEIKHLEEVQIWIVNQITELQRHRGSYVQEAVKEMDNLSRHIGGQITVARNQEEKKRLDELQIWVLSRSRELENDREPHLDNAVKSMKNMSTYIDKQKEILLKAIEEEKIKEKHFNKIESTIQKARNDLNIKYQEELKKSQAKYEKPLSNLQFKHENDILNEKNKLNENINLSNNIKNKIFILSQKKNSAQQALLNARDLASKHARAVSLTEDFLNFSNTHYYKISKYLDEDNKNKFVIKLYDLFCKQSAFFYFSNQIYEKDLKDSKEWNESSKNVCKINSFIMLNTAIYYQEDEVKYTKSYTLNEEEMILQKLKDIIHSSLEFDDSMTDEDESPLFPEGENCRTKTLHYLSTLSLNEATLEVYNELKENNMEINCLNDLRIWLDPLLLHMKENNNVDIIENIYDMLSKITKQEMKKLWNEMKPHLLTSNKIKALLDSKKQDLQNSLTECRKYENEIETLEKEITNLNSINPFPLEQKLHELKNKYENIKVQLKEIAESLKKITSRLLEMNSALDSYKSQYEKIFMRMSQEISNDIDEEIKIINEKIADIQDEILDIEKEQTQYKFLISLTEDYLKFVPTYLSDVNNNLDQKKYKNAFFKLEDILSKQAAFVYYLKKTHYTETRNHTWETSCNFLHSLYKFMVDNMDCDIKDLLSQREKLHYIKYYTLEDSLEISTKLTEICSSINTPFDLSKYDETINSSSSNGPIIIKDCFSPGITLELQMNGLLIGENIPEAIKDKILNNKTEIESVKDVKLWLKELLDYIKKTKNEELNKKVTKTINVFRDKLITTFINETKDILCTEASLELLEKLKKEQKIKTIEHKAYHSEKKIREQKITDLTLCKSLVLKYDVNELQNQYQAKQEQLNDDEKELYSKINKFQKEINLYNMKIAKCTKEINDFQKEKDLYETQITKYQQEIPLLEEQIKNCVMQINTMQRGNLDQLKKQYDVDVAELEKSKTKDLEKINSWYKAEVNNLEKNIKDYIEKNPFKPVEESKIVEIKTSEIKVVEKSEDEKYFYECDLKTEISRSPYCNFFMQNKDLLDYFLAEKKYYLNDWVEVNMFNDALYAILITYFLKHQYGTANKTVKMINDAYNGTYYISSEIYNQLSSSFEATTYMMIFYKVKIQTEIPFYDKVKLYNFIVFKNDYFLENYFDEFPRNEVAFFVRNFNYNVPALKMHTIDGPNKKRFFNFFYAKENMYNFNTPDYKKFIKHYYKLDNKEINKISDYQNYIELHDIIVD